MYSPRDLFCPRNSDNTGCSPLLATLEALRQVDTSGSYTDYEAQHAKCFKAMMQRHFGIEQFDEPDLFKILVAAELAPNWKELIERMDELFPDNTTCAHPDEVMSILGEEHREMFEKVLAGGRFHQIRRVLAEFNGDVRGLFNCAFNDFSCYRGYDGLEKLSNSDYLSIMQGLVGSLLIVYYCA